MHKNVTTIMKCVSFSWGQNGLVQLGISNDTKRNWFVDLLECYIDLAIIIQIFLSIASREVRGILSRRRYHSKCCSTLPEMILHNLKASAKEKKFRNSIN